MVRNDLTLEELDVWGKDKGGWHGRRIAHADVSDADFTKDDVAELIASAESPARWDGISAAILKLKDGRFVSFESFYGPTGTGFYDDAYGGDADIHFGPDVETVVRLGLTDEGRDLLQISHPERT